MVALKPAFGGNIVAPILSKTFPQMATVRQGVLELATPNPARKAEIETVRPQLGKPLTRLVRATSNVDESIAPLEGAEVGCGWRGRNAAAAKPAEDRRTRLRIDEVQHADLIIFPIGATGDLMKFGIVGDDLLLHRFVDIARNAHGALRA